jgi:imidazolonepropionase-like amidohydrolase
METLVGVLEGKILVHNHCYRADEMNLMLDLAREFRFKVRSFHHGLEAYKLAPRLAEENVAVSTWADWWGFKMESYDGIPHNAALLQEAGARPIIHSDSESEIRHLNQEAAKAQAAGRALGVAITDEQAIEWITKNPAWALGIDDRTGTLENGKMGDVVVWDRHPLSVYAHPTRVYIDGALQFERNKSRPVTDWELKNGAPVGGVSP